MLRRMITARIIRRGYNILTLDDGACLFVRAAMRAARLLGRTAACLPRPPPL